MSHLSASSTISGLEVSSDVIKHKELPCNISGIGDVRTSWIGQKGIEEIRKEMAHKQLYTEAKVKCNELRVLASECLKAFRAAGLENSEDVQIRKALKLCQSHLPIRQSATSSIASLWREEELQSTNTTPLNAHSVAVAVLGEELVATVTEENQKPPDVRK